MKKNLICISIVLLILALEISCSTLKSQESPKIIFSRPVNYNPPPVGHWNVFISGSIPLCDVVMEPLTHYFPANNSYLPGLAENWTQSADKMVFTLKLRKGVMWHDGTELTSLDVWATWHCIYLLKDRAWYFLKNVTIIDDSTLVFYMSMPMIMYPSTFSGIGTSYHTVNMEYLPHKYTQRLLTVMTSLKTQRHLMTY